MSKEIKLLPCPFCGGEVILEEYYESCDGRGNEPAKIKCECGLKMSLTFCEFVQAEKDFNYTGGYYSQNKKFWKGIHQRLIEKWNTRKPMDRIVEQLKELECYKEIVTSHKHPFCASEIVTISKHRAIDIVKAGCKV